MTTQMHPSQRIKSLKPETSALVGSIGALAGPSLETIRNFQENLWNDAFKKSIESSYKNWFAIVYLFYDMITFPCMREDQFILCPSIYDTSQVLGKSCLSANSLLSALRRLTKPFVDSQASGKDDASCPPVEEASRENQYKLLRNGMPERLLRKQIEVSSSSRQRVSDDILQAEEHRTVRSYIHRI